MILCFINKGKITNACRGKIVISKSIGERKGLGAIGMSTGVASDAVGPL